MAPAVVDVDVDDGGDAGDDVDAAVAAESLNQGFLNLL